MSQLFAIHPDDPQLRLIHRVVEILNQGGIIVYPTDSCYALGCHTGDKRAIDRIRRIRQLDDKHNLTLMCRDVAEMSLYGVIDNINYRLIKSLTPGPYTFILPATREVPRRVMHKKRKTIGVRIADNNIVSALMAEFREPILTTTLLMPGEEMPMTDPHEMRQLLGNDVELVIDGGDCGIEPTTVVEMLAYTPEIVRQGKGQLNLM